MWGGLIHSVIVAQTVHLPFSSKQVRGIDEEDKHSCCRRTQQLVYKLHPGKTILIWTIECTQMKSMTMPSLTDQTHFRKTGKGLVNWSRVPLYCTVRSNHVAVFCHIIHYIIVWVAIAVLKTVKERLDVFEAKIEEVKGWQSLGIEPRTPGLCSQCPATELSQPNNHQPPTILYMYCTSASVTHLAAATQKCAVRTPLGVDQKILSIKREPILCGFLSL